MFTLNELREIVRLQLIEEAGVVDLANRQLSRMGLISNKDGIITCLMVVSTHEIVKHEGVSIPKVLGLAQAVHEFDANYRLHRLYADNAIVSIFLLAAALEYWKSVFTDHSVSPAAQQVIKRYFEQNKDNPALVEPSADPYKNNAGADFLKAAYLGPVGFDLADALDLGEKAIDKAAASDPEWTRDDVADMVKDAANNGFDRAYNDISKTRHSLEDLYNATAPEDLLSELVKQIQKGGQAKAKALAWLAPIQDEVQSFLWEEHPNPWTWVKYVAPALDALNYRA